MPKNIVNKRHVAHLEQVRRQEKAIRIGAFSIVAVVLLLVLYALVIDPAIKPYRPVASVNGEGVTVAQFQVQGRMRRLQLISQIGQYMQYAEMFGVTDLSTDQNFGPAIRQIQGQLETATLGRAVLDAAIDDQLIRQEAKRRNIVVSVEEVEEALQEGMGYFPKGSPTPTLTIAPAVTSTLNATQLALVSPTPTPGPPTATPTLDPSITPTITPTTGPTQTQPATPLPEPTATPLTLEGYQENLKQQLDYVKEQAKLSESDYRSYYESVVYRKKLQEQIVANLEPFQEQVWARHILVATEEEAKKVLERLGNGEDFGKVASEVSTDTGSGAAGGDLGWFGKGAMVAEFQDAAYKMKVGEISQPIKSEFGFHIIQVLGHENRALDGQGFQTYKDRTFEDFLKTLRDAAKIEEYDLWKEVIPEEPAAPQLQGMPPQ